MTLRSPSTEPDTVRILGIAGSLRAASYNRALLRAAAETSPPGVALTIWDEVKAISPFDEDDESSPSAAVLGLRAAIAQADALLVVTPEYNGSVPGQLKNALDWASRPRALSVLLGKPAAAAGASPSRSGAQAAQATSAASWLGPAHRSSTPESPCPPPMRRSALTESSATRRCAGRSVIS